MKVSLNWLEDFVTLPRIEAAELARQIAEHCFEVEKIIGAPANYAFSNVYTAEVLEVVKHPNADRLRIVKVAVGDRIIQPIVCGAFNFEADDIVALALPGARIPQNVHSDAHESYTLGTAKIRGVESHGMICSGFELGLADAPEEKPEILVLPKGTSSGLALAEYLRSGQSAAGLVLDVALPANRPDLYSHLGIAREFAGILGYKPTAAMARLEKLAAAAPQKKGALAPKIEHTEAAAFYSVARIQVKIAQSPQFIQDRLKTLGLRPINNVVDITNYVMYETGEPLHAFDSARVSGNLSVRSARAGETITTIDHKERKLEPGMPVIADREKALAIAGIMGGLESEVTEATAEILLEAANFNQFVIRRTSKKLGLRTDGSGFWEKGLVREQARVGMLRAIELLKKYAAAQVLETAFTGQPNTPKRNILCTAEQINGLIGSKHTTAAIKKILKRLGFSATGAKTLSVAVPYYRPDVQSFADFADEIIKVEGPNTLPRTPLQITRLHPEADDNAEFMNLKRLMVSVGFNEVQNYSFISAADIAGFGLDEQTFIKVTNPLSVDNGYLKQHLLIPLLKNIHANAKVADDFKLFEIGKGYRAYLDEPDLLTFVIYSKDNSEQLLLAQAKGFVETVLHRYMNDVPKYRITDKGLLEIMSGASVLGNLGPISPQLKQNFDIEHNAVYAKLSLAPIFALPQRKAFVPFSKFPEKALDVSIVIDDAVPWSKIESAVRAAAEKEGNARLLASIEPFEAPYLYAENKLPKFHRDLLEKGKKNVAFRLRFSSPERTLKDSEILPIYDKIIGELRNQLQAEIR